MQTHADHRALHFRCLSVFPVLNTQPFKRFHAEGPGRPQAVLA